MTDAAPPSDWELALAERLQASGWSKSEFARRAKVTYRTVARWASAEHTPRADSRAKVSALGPEWAALIALLPGPEDVVGLSRRVAELERNVQELGDQLRLGRVAGEEASRDILGSLDLLAVRVDELEQQRKTRGGRS